MDGPFSQAVIPARWIVALILLPIENLQTQGGSCGLTEWRTFFREPAMANNEMIVSKQRPLMESRPHFSLTMMGTVYVFLLISLAALMIGLFFARVGAWPVLVYTLIVLMALRLGFQHVWMRSGDYERLWLEDDDLLVEVCELGTTTQHRFNRYWTQIRACSTLPGYCSHLLISAYGRQSRLGRHMNSTQRMELARNVKKHLR